MVVLPGELRVGQDELKKKNYELTQKSYFKYRYSLRIS